MTTRSKTVRVLTYLSVPTKARFYSLSTLQQNVDSLLNTKNWKNYTNTSAVKASNYSTSLATNSASRLQALMHKFTNFASSPMVSTSHSSRKVNGPDASPLFLFLQQQKGFAGFDMEHPIAPILDKMLSEIEPNYKEKADIKWNFTKFLINKQGQVVARFEPTAPIAEIEKSIGALLV